MNDIDIKILSLLFTVIGAVLGFFVSVIYYLWREKRERFVRKMVGLRTMIVFSDMMKSHLLNGLGEIDDIKYEWIVPYFDCLIRDKIIYGHLLMVLKIRSEIMGRKKQKSEIVIELENVMREIYSVIDKERIPSIWYLN